MKKLVFISLIAAIFFSCKEEETPEPITLSVQKTDVTTFGGTNGTIDLTVAGGETPFTFAWSNGATTEDLQNLAIGTYSVTVTDAASQTATETVEISQPEPTIEKVSISVGPGYANDVYYSLANGVVSTPSRTEWDIAFYTNPMSSTILTNDGSGVLLYVWPNGNRENWSSVDTVGLASWNILYNTYSDTTWQNGAFDKGALGHPDYGWGVYNSTSHDVVGDSIHIIKLTDGSLKKLLIEKRAASNNTFSIKFANLDGSNEVVTDVACGSFTSKNMIHYSLKTAQVVEHEPATANWDLVFTKYWDESIPYIVTGALSNVDVQMAEQAETDTASNDFALATYSKVLNTIGSDWKTFNMGTFSYDITPNLVYFMKDSEGNAYKLVFTKFEGSSTGNIEFVKTSY